jgi:hypothetical protein
LPKRRERIDGCPTLANLALDHAPEHHTREFHALARCRDALDFRHVRPRPAGASRNEVILGENILNSDTQVRQHPLECPDVLLHALWPERRTCCVVVEVIRHLLGNRGRVKPVLGRRNALG